MSSVLLLSGHGRYADPWHPFGETSPIIAETLREAGHEVAVRPTVPEAFDDLACDLVVVNCGGGMTDHLAPDPAWQRAFERFGSYLDANPMLALHCAANGFRDWGQWWPRLGGAWVPGVAHHPEIGTATFSPAPGAEPHAVWRGLEAVSCFDERYSDLTIEGEVTPLVHHVTDGVAQVMGWAHGTRVVYDGLGHDARSYESHDRRRLLVQEVAWLLGQ